MITRIVGNGVGGLSFDQPLSRLTLFTGPNGVGKSARTRALLLAVLGFIPGGPKQNPEILQLYGGGDKLIVAIETSDRTHFLRRFAREKGGSVSCEVMLNRRKTTKEAFAAAAAGVKVFDLEAFKKLSDQGKIDYIFALFPPAGDVREIDSKIEKLKKKQSTLEGQLQTLQGTEKTQGTISRLTAARAAIDLPAGTLADVTSQIHELECQLLNARNELDALRIREAEDRGKKGQCRKSRWKR